MRNSNNHNKRLDRIMNGIDMRRFYVLGYFIYWPEIYLSCEGNTLITF